MTQRLQSAGWTADSSFQSHGTTLKKNSADAVFYPANVSVPQGHIDLLGECRDVTTTKAQAETPMSVSRTSQPEDPIKYALTAHEEVVGVADGIAGSLIGQTLVVALSLVIFGVAGA